MKPRYLLCILDIFLFSVCFLPFDLVGGDFSWLGLDLAVMLWLVLETLADGKGFVPQFLVDFFLPKAMDLGLFGCCRRWGCSTVCRGGVLGSAWQPRGLSRTCTLGRKEWKKDDGGKNTARYYQPSCKANRSFLNLPPLRAMT
jgi:hypothetical protein